MSLAPWVLEVGHFAFLLGEMKHLAGECATQLDSLCSANCLILNVQLRKYYRHAYGEGTLQTRHSHANEHDLEILDSVIKP